MVQVMGLRRMGDNPLFDVLTYLRIYASLGFDGLIYLLNVLWINTLRPRHNDRHFAEAIFKWILLDDNIWV